MPDWIDREREELGELLELLEMEVSLSSDDEEVGHSTFQSAYRTRLFTLVGPPVAPGAPTLGLQAILE